MQHISDALNRLHEECAWFTRAREVRLLIVRTSGDVRHTIVKLVPQYEFHADNRSPWIVLEDPFAPATPLWESRAARILQHWERRRAAFAAEGAPLPEAVPRQLSHTQIASDHSGLAVFFHACVAVLDALRSPLEGLVVVAAPPLVEGVEVLDRHLARLFRDREFAGCRLVLVIDAEVPLPVETLAELGDAALICDCTTDERQKWRDFQMIVGDADGGGAPAAGAQPPGVTPPRRVNAPPEADPVARAAALRQAGIDPAYIEHAPALRRLILNAALAMGDGRHAEAIRLQTDAVAVGALARMPQITAICQITLASYLSGAGERQRALMELSTAAALADAHGLRDQESQAFLAQGLLYTLEKQPLQAADAYRRCAEIAESSGGGILAIEARRLAAQAAIEGGDVERAVAHMKQALNVAGELDAAARANSSAAEVARRLARMYAEAGYGAQAQALQAQADAIEQGESADPAPPSEVGGSPAHQH